MLNHLSMDGSITDEWKLMTTLINMKTIVAEDIKPALLLVDDEANVLSSLKRLLHDEDYKIIIANSASEGLELLNKYHIGVIVTDQRMPNMTGTEFLVQVKQSHPQTIRMVMTGYADMESVTRAVNEGAIYKFLVKPWDPEMLIITIREAFNHYHLSIEKAQLTEKIKSANEELTSLNDRMEQTLKDRTQQLVKATQYDSVTRLPNRLLFSDRLNHAFSVAKRNQKRVAVLIAGIDRFNLINQTHGHLAGDNMLSGFAERLKTCLRESDTLAKFAGDEFAVIMAEFSEAQDVVDVAQKILQRFKKPFSLGGSNIFSSISIGIAVYPDDGMDEEVIIKHASTAMHNAKNSGNTFKFYAPEMNRDASQRFELENELRHAVERQEFILYYQPKIDIKTGAITGAETLLRWQHPEKGIIGPGYFIDLLEETGLIVTVGRWVIQQAFQQTKLWQELGLLQGGISINLSVRQLQDSGIVDDIRAAIKATGVEPQSAMLEFEVTESLVINNVEYTIQQLKDLTEMGFQIAIDDFGTGYASLSYITRFPANTLKIDLSFIQRIQKSENDANLVIAIIAMAHGLGLTVVAEGVETEQQLEFLREHNCDQMQGYLYSKPVSSEDFRDLLMKKSSAPHRKIITDTDRP